MVKIIRFIETCQKNVLPCLWVKIKTYRISPTLRQNNITSNDDLTFIAPYPPDQLDLTIVIIDIFRQKHDTLVF